MYTELRVVEVWCNGKVFTKIWCQVCGVGIGRTVSLWLSRWWVVGRTVAWREIWPMNTCVDILSAIFSTQFIALNKLGLLVELQQTK